MSILSSCVKRKTQDDFHDEEKRPYVKYKPATWRGSSGFGPWMVLDDGIQDSDDPELHFRRRPKTVCLADPRRYYWSSDEETFPLSRAVSQIFLCLFFLLLFPLPLVSRVYLSGLLYICRIPREA